MRFGIVTHYYNSNNYGGNLQAYALCKVIEQNGYCVEQLCVPIDYYKKMHFPKQQIIDLKVWFYSLFKRLKYRDYYKKHKDRNSAIQKFNKESIPHSETFFDLKNIKKALSCYQAFITGSDIVWGPKIHSPFFFLNFVPSDTPKFSYAASLGTNQLTEDEEKFFKEDLSSYQAVSVREQSVVSVLETAIGKKVELCIDPTLLLNENDWNKICSSRIVDEKYVFCYFLGRNSSAINVAKEYSKKYNLKLVNIPYLSKNYDPLKDFGDIKLSNVSPSDFISLIKYSDMVFTDSFHACVFSSIYDKDVFAFRRDNDDKLGVRVSDFLSFVGMENHYCDTDEKETLEYLQEQIKRGQSYYFEGINALKEKSIVFLKDNLKKAEETIKQNEK